MLVAQICLTLCDPRDCSLPGFSVQEILQTRILEWVAISFSSGSPWHRDWIRSPALQADSLLYEPPGKPSALEPIGYWVGPGLGIKMAASRIAHGSKYSPVSLPPVFWSLQWAIATPYSLGNPPSSPCRSDQGFYEVTTFPLGFSTHETLCALSESGVSTCPVLLNSCYQASLTFKAKCSGSPSSWFQTPRLGSLMRGLELIPVGELLQ